MKARSGCAARWRPAPGPTKASAWPTRRASCSARFPRPPQCTSQVGRPDDGTDTTGFFNTEYFVDLKPKEQWRPVFHQNKDELIAAMNRELEQDSRRDLGISRSPSRTTWKRRSAA